MKLRNQKTLTLEKKIRVLDYGQDHPKLGFIANVFDVEKTSIAHALKDKQNIRAQYEAFISAAIS